MNNQHNKREHNAVYGPLSLEVDEDAKRPKQSVVLFLSALGGEYLSRNI